MGSGNIGQLVALRSPPQIAALKGLGARDE